METKLKELYDAPSTMVFGVKQEGVICASEVKSGNSIKNWENGDTTNVEVYM